MCELLRRSMLLVIFLANPWAKAPANEVSEWIWDSGEPAPFTQRASTQSRPCGFFFCKPCVGNIRPVASISLQERLG